jgi:signal transduction histidine kinase
MLKKTAPRSDEPSRGAESGNVRHDHNDELGRRLRNQMSMLAIVAHDLRNPLFRLALAAELADGAGDHRAALARNLEATRGVLAVMKRLIDDLDDYSSLQAGRLRLVRRPVDPAVIVKSAVAAFAPFAETRKVALTATISDTVQPIRADHDRLLQVVSNLIMNALFLTPPGGLVVVAVDLVGDHARFAVSDSGPGINPDDLPHLFERGWRGTHDRYAGRGLGLAIAKGLVESHGGKIWAVNQPARGARIAFAIPISEAT